MVYAPNVQEIPSIGSSKNRHGRRNVEERAQGSHDRLGGNAENVDVAAERIGGDVSQVRVVDAFDAPGPARVVASADAIGDINIEAISTTRVSNMLHVLDVAI